MEQWQTTLEGSHSEDVGYYRKTLQVAEKVVQEDLAEFEIDWFFKTLLYKPVSILNIIKTKNRDDAWFKIIMDAFKLLTSVIEKYDNSSVPYLENIVKVCEVVQDARTKSYSLSCLCVCARRYELDADSYIAALQDTSACRAPLAILVGKICEYHPETVTDAATNVWRVFLNMLECNKNTDTVICAVLQGISGLFKHFGTDLPVMELNKFYEKLSREFIRISKCQKVILSILSDYPHLFKEVITSDRALRAYIWNLSDSACAIKAIYNTVIEEIGAERCQEILTEILPHTTNYNCITKYTALRLVCYLQQSYNIQSDVLNDLDIHTVEFELRNELSFEKTEALHFIIDCKLLNTERILQTCILNYENIQANKRKNIVINGILKSEEKVMESIINYLSTQSCLPDGLPTFSDVWRDILTSDLMVERRRFLSIYIRNLVLVMEGFMEDTAEKKLPEKLSGLLTLTNHILILYPADDYSNELSSTVSPFLIELFELYGSEISIVTLLRGLLIHVEDKIELMDIYNTLDIEKCCDEATACEMSLTLLQLDEQYKGDGIRMKIAIEIVLSRKDAEPKVLIQALRHLDRLFEDSQKVDEKLIKLVEKLRYRKDLVDKESRILKRDVALFLGKYSVSDLNNNLNVDLSIIDLHNKIKLDIPNSIEGITYKMDLLNQLQIAIEEEDQNVLTTLLSVICSNPNISTPSYQHLLGAIIAALGRSDTHAVITNAAGYCGSEAIRYIMQLMLKSSAPGIRKMLADIVEGMLLKSQDLMDTVYQLIVEVLQAKEDATATLAALDLLQALLEALKDNNQFIKTHIQGLPLILIQTNEHNTHLLLDKLTEIIRDKIELFETSTIENLATNIIEKLLENSQSSKVKIKSALRLIKIICQLKSVKIYRVIRVLFDSCHLNDSRILRILSELGLCFDELLSNEILTHSDEAVLKMLYRKDVNNKFDLENVLFFMSVFSNVLLNHHYEVTVSFINEKIFNIITPENMPYLKMQLSDTLIKLNKHIEINTINNWIETLPLEEITRQLTKNDTKYHSIVKNIKFLLELLNIDNPSTKLTTLSVYAQRWPKIVLKTYAGYYSDSFKSQLSFLTDVMSVAVKFLTVTDVKKLLQEGHALLGVSNARVGVEFVRLFMPAFVKCFLVKPFLLSDTELVVADILTDVVKVIVRKKMMTSYDDMFELIEEIWPLYSNQSNFTQKLELLQELIYLDSKLSFDSKLMIWASNMVEGQDVSVSEKVALVRVLPGGDGFSTTYRQYASLLPTRVSDLRGNSNSILRALLDALSNTGDRTLLSIVCTLAGGDSANGWWDDAFQTCMASLSQRTDVQFIYRDVYQRCWEGNTDGVCRRLLVPLIRYSTHHAVVEFFSTKLSELLAKLRFGQKVPSAHSSFFKCIRDDTTAVLILSTVLDKVPTEYIESPTSPLYKDIKTDKSWHIVREICKLGQTLRNTMVPPKDAGPDVVKYCRIFQQTSYNCQCLCISVWKPVEKVYKTLFDVKTWIQITDLEKEYKLPIKSQWNTRKINVPVSVPSSTTSSSASTVRTKLFLRTLTENPLLYDLIEENPLEEVETQEIQLPSNELNSHPCAATLTALLRHVAEQKHTEWAQILSGAMSTAHRNTRWILAQAICNSTVELKTYANALRAGLLATIVDTLIEHNGKKLINGLHVDIIKTLISWSDISEINTIHINIITEHFIHTLMDNGDRQTVFRSLLLIFNDYLDVYGKYCEIKWSVFQHYVDDIQASKNLIPILTKITKNKLLIPELIPHLLSKMAQYQTHQLSKVAELLGFAIQCDKNCQVGGIKKLLDQFRRKSVNDYVKLIYYSKYCDEQQFRIIVDLAQKLPASERNKCIEVIQTYISSHPRCDEEVPQELMVEVQARDHDRRFLEFIKTSPEYNLEPPTKKPRLSTNSKILNTIANNENNFFKMIHKVKKDIILEVLTENNLCIRFMECFYVTTYLPIMYCVDRKPELSNCIAELFSMLFCELKNDERFKEAKLEGVPLKDDKIQGFSKLLTQSKTYMGTLRSCFNYTRKKIQETTSLDVQIPIEKILDSLIEFSKSTPKASIDLLKQLFLCIKSRDFDSRIVMAQLLSKLVLFETGLVELGRSLVDELATVDGILEQLKKLEQKMEHTDKEDTVKLLSQEVKLRKLGPEQFILGNAIDDQLLDVEMGDESYSLEDAVLSFKKLSNWDDLTLQMRRSVQASGIPCLWTDRQHFQQLLEDYEETDTWFGKMVSLYHGKTEDGLKWLSQADRPPRHLFEISAIAEGLNWNESRLTSTVFNKNGCYIEWATRYMMRSAISNKLDPDIHLSPSNELQMGMRAIEMELPHVALQCMKRNTVDLYDYDTLKWLSLKVEALKMIGFKQNDDQTLKKALQTAEKYTPMFLEVTDPAIVTEMYLIMYELKDRLKLFTPTERRTAEQNIHKYIKSLSNNDNFTRLSAMYATCFMYFTSEWDIVSDSQDRNEYINHLIDTVEVSLKLQTHRQHFLAMLFNKLLEIKEFDDEIIQRLKTLLTTVSTQISPSFVQLLRHKLEVHPTLFALQQTDNTYNACLQLLCVPDYTLMNYCTALYAALVNKDENAYKTTFIRMKNKIFENPYIGNDFQALIKYKSQLYNIEKYDPLTPPNILQSIINELQAKRVSQTLSIEQLCPKLKYLSGEVNKLLGFDENCEVIFEDKLQVYTDSVGRPCVLTVRVSGKKHRFLIKNEETKRSAAAVVIADCVPICNKGYNIIRLSDDCSIIQFLEDHVRFRELISSSVNLEELPPRQSTKDEELILSPINTSLKYYQDICDKIPAYTLRSAIELKCLNVQDFINKKRAFVNTISSNTIMSFYLGLGDRHLENILYNLRTGEVTHVDLDALLHYSDDELLPGRLTRNIVAMCDGQVLESRLQKTMESMRNNSHYLIELTKFCFDGNDDEFVKKLQYMEAIAKGTMLSHQIAVDNLMKSNKKYKEKYVQLLEDIFQDVEIKDNYTVQEQVSNLLVHCTDARILSVTRSGWEPWI